MKITKKVLLENEFYLYSEHGGGPASYTITNGTLEILYGKQRLEFPYPYDPRAFTVWNAILTEAGEVFLIVGDWLDDDDYILKLSKNGTNHATVGYGLADFLVVNGDAYLLYTEEGVFHEDSDKASNGFSCYVLLKWDSIRNKMERVLADQFWHSMVDGNSLCFDGKENLLIFYYGDEYGNCCLKYNLATNQGERYKVPTYYDWSYYYDNSCFGFDGKGIAEFNSKLELVSYIALDIADVHQFIGGYQTLIAIKNDKSCSIYQ
ncbi:hypothetical protein [Paenilisteria newyorkensis]|uniref:hypothetical protein n=2 Tax=Listeria TaxID=1637 RepID=UPI000669EA4B|nr:hypothetical protein [Listeria newyorkensis]KMT58536.1 hypothetical protein X559_3016 [Listeria newyorkensis]